MSQRMQAFLVLFSCARRHNKRNTLYLGFYVWDERRNTSRSLCNVPVFVLNRLLTIIWCLCTNLSKNSHLPHLESRCWAVVVSSSAARQTYKRIIAAIRVLTSRILQSIKWPSFVKSQYFLCKLVMTRTLPRSCFCELCAGYWLA
jgi:hypothetical protein